MAHLSLACFVVLCGMTSIQRCSSQRTVLVLFAALACWVCTGVTWGQAQIINGGFESFSALPDASGQLGLVNGWANGGSDVAMPDYYHEQGANGGDLPQTPLAKVDAFSGRAVVGLVAYTDEVNPRHEYLTGSFAQPLTEGQRYKMSFAITSGRVHDWVPAGIGVGGLGVVLTTSPPAQQGHEQLTKSPQFRIHETLYDRYWRQIAFVFTASDEFTHFTFGLFESEEIRLSREEGDERTMAYYFLDDFAIEEVAADLMSEERPDRGTPGTPIPEGAFIPSAFTPDGDLMNDQWTWALPESVVGSLVVFDRWGHVVWEAEVAEGAHDVWDGTRRDGTPCAPGVFGWRLTTQIPIADQSEWKGWVNVIR
jgi:gliding motility-associated-like protein